MIDDELARQAREAALTALQADEATLERGRELHAALFTSDCFGFLPRTLSPEGYDKLLRMVGSRAGYDAVYRAWEEILLFGPLYSAAARARFEAVLDGAGLDCMVATVGSERTLHHSLHRIAMHQRMFDALPDLLRKCLTRADVEQACRDGRLAVVCSANGAPANTGVEDHAAAHAWIDVLFNSGIRIMHLTYNARNWIGDGCMEAADAGLSSHGRDVVKHLNDLGIVVDTPHTGRRTTLDAARCSRAPIMATHTACRAVYDHPRGKSDDELKAIADSGGLIGICMIGRFLGEPGTLRDFLDHVDYAVNLVGPDHVAIGTDLVDAGPPPANNVRTVPGFPERPGSGTLWWQPPPHENPEPVPKAKAAADPSLAWINWPLFTVGLVTLGYDRDTIAKLLGQNLLRVLQAVELAAGAAG